MTSEGGPPEQPAPVPEGVTRATVQLADGPVTILPKRAPVGNSGPIRGRTLAVLATPSAAMELHVALTEHGAECFTAVLAPGARPAVAVANLAEADALAIGRALGLVEILFWDGRRAHVLACR